MKTKSENFIYEASVDWQSAGEGAFRQIMAYDKQVMLVKVKFEQGAIGASHSHFHAQASLVLKGKFQVEIDGEKQILSEGDSFYVAPDTPHGVVCLEAGVLLDTFSPARQDFLK